jgi:hypothetical protein
MAAWSQVGRGEEMNRNRENCKQIENALRAENKPVVAFLPQRR